MGDPAAWWLFLFFVGLTMTLGVVVGFLWGREYESKEWRDLDQRERAQRALRDIANKSKPATLHDWWSAYSNQWGTDPRGGSK